MMRPVAAAALLLCLAAGRAGAASFAVVNTHDSGPGSFRQAIVDSNSLIGTDTITFGPTVTGAIILASALPALTDSVVILGPGIGVLRVDANASSRLLDISATSTVMLSHLNMANGRIHASEVGAGIRNAGTLTIFDCVVANSVADGSGARGGGIRNDGLLTIIDSTFLDNQAIGALTAGGGIDNAGTLRITGTTFVANHADSIGGAIFNTDRVNGVTITNSTFSDNSSDSVGGAIANDGAMTISYSTFADNSAAFDGGAVYNLDAGNTVTYKSTMIQAGSGGSCFGGTVTALGVNLATDATCPGFTQVTAAQLALGPLDFNGGTQTHALLTGSVAIDAASDCTDALGNPVSTDQRGAPRPRDGDGIGGPACDVGAFELAGVAEAVPTLGYAGLLVLAALLAALGAKATVRR